MSEEQLDKIPEGVNRIYTSVTVEAIEALIDAYLEVKTAPKKKLPIEEYFTYHPPQTEESKQKHETINRLTLELAKVIDELIENEETKKMALFALQQARMFANQGITVDELHK